MSEQELIERVAAASAALSEMNATTRVLLIALQAAVHALVDVARLAIDHGDAELAELAIEKAQAVLAAAQEAK